MKSLPLLVAALALLAISCALTGASDDAVATAIFQTEGARTVEALVLTETARAMATSTPTSTATATETPTATSTPEPTATPTPPPGKAYAPNLIGMKLLDAEAMLKELGYRWIYVAQIKTDIPEWQVYEQSPAPGSLFETARDRFRLVVAVRQFTPTPKPVEERPAAPAPGPCGDIDYFGVCIGNVVYFCDDNQLWYWDCNACGGVCAWSDYIGYYCYCP